MKIVKNNLQEQERTENMIVKESGDSRSQAWVEYGEELRCQRKNLSISMKQMACEMRIGEKRLRKVEKGQWIRDRDFLYNACSIYLSLEVTHRENLRLQQENRKMNQTITSRFVNGKWITLTQERPVIL